MPLGWVDRHLQKINAVCMEGKRRSAHLSMMWELGAYKHWKFDDTMKSWARVVLDEKKRALHELGWKNHQKNISRTIQFWTRSVQIYASYKVQVTPSLQLHFFQNFSCCGCLRCRSKTLPHYSSTHVNKLLGY